MAFLRGASTAARFGPLAHCMITPPSALRRWSVGGVVLALLLVAPVGAGSVLAAGATPTTFVAAPPSGAKGPDDITLLAVPGLDGGRAVIWTAYQNGINPDGTPGSAGGPTQSTLAGYDATSGALVKTIRVTGKCDGLTADPGLGRLVATVNEDSHSALDLVDVASGTVTTYRYEPDPAVGGKGGTDSIAIFGGQIVVSHSNPNDTTQATDYAVTLDDKSHTAHLTALFADNGSASDAITGKSVTLGLTDPDTNAVMPNEAPRFGGQLATISQGDGEIVFATAAATPALTVLTLHDNVTGNVPPIDGFAVATSAHGTLYIVDAKAGTISALDTIGWPAGTVFVGEPNDSGNPLVGTLDLASGTITPLLSSFGSPKGLLFVPAAAGVARYQVTTTQYTLAPNYYDHIYIHHFTVVTNPCDGTLTMSGATPVDSGYYTEETVAGMLANGVITFSAVYTTPPLAGGQWSGTFPVAGGPGTLSWTEPGWSTFTGDVTVTGTSSTAYKNHGDYVSSMGGGADAAHSCIGMPIH